MTYLTQNKIASSLSMMDRVAQAVTQEGTPLEFANGDVWAQQYRREWASAPGWSEAWESALVSHPDDDDIDTPPYDPGADEGVITDGMILSQVQGMLAAQAPSGDGGSDG